MVDNESAVDILYYNAFIKMGLKDSDLKPVTNPLYSFTSASIMSHGRIDVPLTVGGFPKTSTAMTKFLVVDCPSAFNALLGRPTLKALKVVTSIYHLAMRFLTLEGIETVKGS